MRQQQVKDDAVMEVIMALAETIKATGDDGIPSGHLYAASMGVMSLESYEMIISTLVRAGIVTRSNHVLRWARPN